jgi:hypothetical protein
VGGDSNQYLPKMDAFVTPQERLPESQHAFANEQKQNSILPSIRRAELMQNSLLPVAGNQLPFGENQNEMNQASASKVNKFGQKLFGGEYLVPASELPKRMFEFQ